MQNEISWGDDVFSTNSETSRSKSMTFNEFKTACKERYVNLVGEENFKSLCEYVINKADKIIAYIDKEIELAIANTAIVTVVVDMTQFCVHDDAYFDAGNKSISVSRLVNGNVINHYRKLGYTVVYFNSKIRISVFEDIV